MPEVRWSRRAKAKLENIAPATRDQLTSDAGKILHYIPPVLFPHDEGFAGEVMWHRGIACGMLSEDLLAQEDDDGPWNYFLLYTPQLPDVEEPDLDRKFQVLDICGIADIARRWRG
jgi:hypothetical protein